MSQDEKISKVQFTFSENVESLNFESVLNLISIGMATIVIMMISFKNSFKLISNKTLEIKIPSWLFLFISDIYVHCILTLAFSLSF